MAASLASGLILSRPHSFGRGGGAGGCRPRTLHIVITDAEFVALAAAQPLCSRRVRFYDTQVFTANSASFSCLWSISFDPHSAYAPTSWVSKDGLVAKTGAFSANGLLPTLTFIFGFNRTIFPSLFPLICTASVSMAQPSHGRSGIRC